MKKIIGGVITLVIGGMVFSVSQKDLVKNFSKETGMSQEESQQYVDSIKEEDFVAYDKIGADKVTEGESIIKTIASIDCEKYTYEWETPTLSCSKAKAQFMATAKDEVALGKAYIVLSTSTATKADIRNVINLIEANNNDLNFEIINIMLDKKTIEEEKKINSYNKALLQTALESDK